MKGHMTMNLTPKQLKILQLIRDWRVRRGYSPTMQELADEIGVSKVTVFEHVEALIKKNALVREPNKARSLSIAEGISVPDEARPMRFPLVGKIAAGHPIERVANEEEIDLGEILGQDSLASASTFALKVEGDSMRDEGILDGDYILVERTQTATNGERVVALLPDGSTTRPRRISCRRYCSRCTRCARLTIQPGRSCRGCWPSCATASWTARVVMPAPRGAKSRSTQTA